MQGHMFWALFIHAQDAQDVRDDRGQAEDVWDDLQEPAPALPGDAVAARADGAPARADARGHADRLLHARHLRRVLGPDRARLHALLGPARRHPGHVLDRLVRPVPDRRHRVLRRDDGEEQRARSGSSSARGATSACAATRRTATRSTSASQSVWGVQRYFEEQLDFFDRWLPDDAHGPAAGRGAGAHLRDGRRLRPQDGRRQARPRRPLARRAGVAARAGRDHGALPPRATAASRPNCRRQSATPRTLHLRPGAPGADARRPLLLDRRAAGRGRRAWSRPGRGS